MMLYILCISVMLLALYEDDTNIYNLNYMLILLLITKQLYQVCVNTSLNHKSVWFAYDSSISAPDYVFPLSPLFLADCCTHSKW